jgi:hypothetical protein
MGRKKNIIGWSVGLILVLSGMASAWPIPDTGQTKCYDNTGEIPCPQPGEPFYGQDGNYTTNPPSYTKLDANGNDLPESASSWVMVRDNVTGLIWENKSSDGSIHDGSKALTWCDTNPGTNGSNQGTCGTGTGDAATDTEAFINALNAASFGGYSDWRLPTRKELRTIADYGRVNPAINSAYFPSTVASYYWSSTILVPDTSYAWDFYFSAGPDYYSTKSQYWYVRAVRGGKAESQFIDNGDGTVTHTSTGLMWQQATAPGFYTWEQALSYCENLTLAGHSDWRLPTIKELDSIVDLTRYNPAINTTYFPDTAGSPYWSSTTLVFGTDYAWFMVFGNDPVRGGHKPDSHRVRAVRITVKTVKKGDVNGDSSIDLADAILCLNMMREKASTAEIYMEADVNGDGKIGMAEVIYILQKVAGLRP